MSTDAHLFCPNCGLQHNDEVLMGSVLREAALYLDFVCAGCGWDVEIEAHAQYNKAPSPSEPT